MEVKKPASSAPPIRKIQYTEDAITKPPIRVIKNAVIFFIFYQVQPYPTLVVCPVPPNAP